MTKSIKRIFILLAMIFSFLVYTGCTNLFDAKDRADMSEETRPKTSWEDEWNDIKKDFEEVNQKIELYSADGKVLLTLTDNEEIFYFTKHLKYEKWDYSADKIPPEALKLCIFISYKENTGEMIEAGRDAVYFDENSYYMLSETPFDAPLQVKMSDDAALYLIELLDIDKSGSSITFADEYKDKAISDYEAIQEDEEDEEDIDPFSDLTYGGMLAASKTNRINICSNGEIIQKISDNKEIYEFLMSLRTSEWSYIKEIPDSAKQTCSINFYQKGRRKDAGKLVEQWRQILYIDGEKYYIDMLIDGDGSDSGFNEAYPQQFLIPSAIGEALLKYCE